MHGRRQARPSTTALVTNARPLLLHRPRQPQVVLVDVTTGGDPAEGHRRQLRLVDQQLESGPLPHGLRQLAGQLDGRGDRLPEGLRAVGSQRRPELQRPERPRVLHGAVDGVGVALVLDHVRRIVAEGGTQRPGVADEEDATGLGHEQPLVRVDGDRVGPVQPGEEVTDEVRARRRHAVSAVDVEPRAAAVHDLRDRADGIDGTGQRRTGGGDHGQRRDARRSVRRERGGQGCGIHPAPGVDGHRPQRVPTEPQHLDGPLDTGVSLGAGIDGRAHATKSRTTTLGEGAGARRHQCREVREHAAAGDRARAGGVPDQAAHPTDRLLLDEERSGRLRRQVHVV